MEVPAFQLNLHLEVESLGPGVFMSSTLVDHAGLFANLHSLCWCLKSPFFHVVMGIDDGLTPVAEWLLVS